MLFSCGVEWWPEPTEQPADGRKQVYDVDRDVVERWRAALSEYLQARAPIVGQLERQGWRAQDRDPREAARRILAAVAEHQEAADYVRLAERISSDDVVLLARAWLGSADSEPQGGTNR